MGLASGPATLPPALRHGVARVAGRLYAGVRRGVGDPAVDRARLMELERARAAGEIGEDEAARREAALVRRPWPAGPDRYPEV